MLSQTAELKLLAEKYEYGYREDIIIRGMWFVVSEYVSVTNKSPKEKDPVKTATTNFW